MTDVALRDYMDRRIDDLDKRIDQRLRDLETRVEQHFTLIDVALNKAERSINERLVNMNEFREALKDQANRMATRAEVEAVTLQVNRMATRAELEGVTVQVNELRRSKANLDGRLAIISGGISAAVAVALWVVTHFAK